MKTGMTTRVLTRMALLIALNVILERTLSLRIVLGGVEGIRIGFGPLPVVFAGIFLGPLAGGLVGAVGDLIGFFINPTGPYMPHFMLTAALRGALPGLLILLAGKGRREVGVFPLFLAVASMFVLVNVFLLPYFLETLFGVMRAVTVPPKIGEAVVLIPAYTAILYALGRALEKILVQGPDKNMLRLTARIW
ncbi:MAG: folate family ECF transporter S component [Firmicutes bacterium]|nr:folate family ECF transporter S component [Bacillota bacterium]